jgi:hypothetical protein
MTPTQERLHHEHKARLARMRSAAWRPPVIEVSVEPGPEPEPKPRPKLCLNPHHRPLPKRVMARITEAMTKIDGCPPPEVLLGKGRKAYVVLWRQTLVHAIREHSDRTFWQIARHIGGRDHGTIIHALRKAETAVAEGKSRVVMSDGFEFHVFTEEEEIDGQRN